MTSKFLTNNITSNHIFVSKMDNLLSKFSAKGMKRLYILVIMSEVTIQELLLLFKKLINKTIYIGK